MEALIQKYKTQLLLTGAVIVLAVLSSLVQSFLKEKPKPLSLDEMIPEGFALIPIEINNSEDIIHLIGPYGVIDLYTYSPHTGLPQERAAQALKVIPVKGEENRFAVIAPEKEVVHLLEHRGPFYAVVQNPKKNRFTNSQKKNKKTSDRHRRELIMRQKFPVYKISRFLCSFLILFFSSSTKATIAWIKAPQTSFMNFKAHIDALEAPHITYAEHQLSQARKTAKTFQLIDRIQKAQEFYLSGTLPSAKEAFQSIARLAHKADWNEEDRRVIFYAFLRNAQLEDRADIKRAFLLSAIQFSQEPITSRHADYTLFPPPLTEKFNALLESQVFFTVNWKEIFPKHEIILINGKRVPSDKSFKIPEGLYWITALSSSHAPWSKTINLSRLLSRTIHTKALTTGPCKDLKIAPPWEEKSVRLLSPECPVPLKFAVPAVKPEEETASVSPELNLLEKELSAQALSSQKTKVPKKISTIPKWIWVAGGIATISFVIYLSSSQTTQPAEPIFYD